MCGICGQYYYKNNFIVNPVDIKRMMETMTHRGPDDEGYYISGPIGLGFRRLSIIDLEGGHQPMTDAEQSVWVVFNGEIYNFKDLRSELEGCGYSFRTKSDTEVIVHGYKQWGKNVLDRLNGMFGLSIWDAKNKVLILARDRMGIKPIYYKLESSSLVFASEIRALFNFEKQKARVDPVAMSLFLQYRYTPSPFTIFQGIMKLAPGTMLIIENGNSRLERWWRFSPIPFDPMPREEEAEEHLLELYLNAVERHLISDVPLGLLLSGGLDSGLLLALMNRYGNSWKTFTVGFGKKYISDELSAAADTAENLGALNYEIAINREIFEEALPEIISKLEEPVAASSVVPMSYLCKRAREDVKVVFMGQGPDELFGGYRRHLGARYGVYWRSMPEWMRTPVRAALNYFTRNHTIERGLYALDIPHRMKRYQHIFSIVPDNMIHDLFQEGILNPGDGSKMLLECWHDFDSLMEHTDELGGLQFLEIRSSLPDELLMYADKLSMAYGLEVRVPYLDKDIVEYVERLSASFKVRNWSGKRLHKKICKRFLPEEIISRRKLGFSTPVNEWFRESVTARMDNALSDSRSMIYKYLRPEAVTVLLNEYRNRNHNNYKILFSLVFLEEWMRNFTR